MILPAAASTQKIVQKALYCDSESDTNSESQDDAMFSDEEESESEDELCHPVLNAKAKLQATWKRLNPPVKENQILGKWYAIIYASKRSSMLFVAKVLRRFLHDENSQTQSLEIKCLKPKVGSGTTLEDTPDHLPDISLFALSDVIAGPLEVVPLKGSAKFDVPNMRVLSNIKNLWPRLIETLYYVKFK